MSHQPISASSSIRLPRSRATSSSIPLRLVHLMVCTAVVAIYFGVTRELHIDQSGDVYEAVLWMLWGTGAGVAISGLVLCTSRFARRRNFLTQPGEWLWVIIGVACALRLALRAADPIQSFHGYTGAASLIVSVVMALLFVGAAIRTEIYHWRCCFGFCSVLHLVALWLKLFGVTHLADLFSYAATALILLLVVTVDVLRRQKRGWTHWVGVAIWPWFTILLFGWLLYQILLIELGLDATSHAT